MLNKTFLNNGGFIWPPCLPKSMQCRQSVAFLPFQHQISSGRVRHQAFAVGFFGFHYVRATVENVPSLRKDSLRRLTELLENLQITDFSVKELDISARRSYLDFKEMVIKKISLKLGDHFSPAVQWIVEFGFQLASTHSFLVGVSEHGTVSGLKGSLNYLESRLSYLLQLARKSDISETLLTPLIESLEAMKCRKTKATARKCCKLMGLFLSQLLVTSTAVKLLN